MKKRHSRLALTLTLGATLTLTSTFTPATAYPEVPTSRVDNIHCSSLHGGLAENGLPRPNMTRSDLAEALNTTSNLGDISYLLEGISGHNYAGRLADRAVACGIVWKDPQEPLPAIKGFQLLSQLLSS